MDQTRANITSFDELMMRRCYELAQLGAGNVSPNPKVGSVIVWNNQIIGEGYHQAYGEAHAEVNAISSVQAADLSKLKDSTIYVSLEPCFHFGKTPPCVDLILKHQIPRVVIAMQDPTSKVGGQSIEKLRRLGVEVIIGVLEDEASQLIRRFKRYHMDGRPYIILKWAQSADGYIGQTGQQVWLTKPISKRLVHQWRAKEGAILIGTNTALIDNPKLNNRLYYGHSPLRMVLDKRHRIPRSHHLLDDGHPTVYFSTSIRAELPKHIEPILVKDWDQLIPKYIISYLMDKKINSLIVEGGKQLLQSFIEAGLWDEARIFSTKKILGEGVEAPQFTRRPNNILEIGNDILQYTYNGYGHL